jgi:ADP-ribosylglycohydrolase
VIEEQLTGSILGQALGDALGFVVEAEPPEAAQLYVDDWLRAGRAGQRSHPQYPFGQYTDDTQLARELLRSFEQARGWDPAVFAERIAELFRERREVGAGRGTRTAALRLLQGVPWQESGTPAPYAGNGAAMRAGPLGLLLPGPSAMCRAAEEQARITHLDPRCAAGSLVIARAVALAAHRGSLQPRDFIEDLAATAGIADSSVAAVVEGLADWAGLPPIEAARHVHACGLDPAHSHTWQGISAFVTPSVLWSVYSFLRSPDDYWETICTAIAVGGDTDTMAAMAGAISGARLGVDALPSGLLARVNDRGQWGAQALSELGGACAAIVESH